MAILELAEVGEMNLAYATLRLVSAPLEDADKITARPIAAEGEITRIRLLEQRLAALAAMRTNQKPGLPNDYYGTSSKQQRRDDIGKQLQESVPQINPLRLVTLLQQAVKWQSHTGQVPTVKELWSDEEGKQHKRRKFDLVLGEASVGSYSRNNQMLPDLIAEPIPSKLYSTISFGKKATAEVALFLPDGASLVTGSSDGLIEIWSSSSRYKELRMDLPYQQREELMGHDDLLITALSVSKDGTLLGTGDASGLVKVWRLDSGKCLREIAAHPQAPVSCLDFSPDASHVLSASHDTTCREFGLRTSRMLKEFRGHSSFVNTCAYLIVEETLLRVVTGSADGTCRIWDGKSSEILVVLRPFSLGASMTKQGTSIVQKLDAPNVDGCPNLFSVIPLHSPPECMILVPRGQRAFMVSLTGVVMQTYDVNNSNCVFIAAAVSPSNKWLYLVSDLGSLHVFDATNGNEETAIHDFSRETCGQSKTAAPEITSLVHHPHKGILAAFSNDKSQKKGLLGVWK
jgi:WD40 repeat-containing protein SMU1